MGFLFNVNVEEEARERPSEWYAHNIDNKNTFYPKDRAE